jgi:hypothetical protein
VSWFNALQLALGAAALVLIARRLQALLFEAPLDVAAFAEALRTALDAGQPELAGRIAAACSPAWPAQLAQAALAEQAGAGNVAAVVDEALLDLEDAAFRGLTPIVALGRMASPLAFIGVLLELARAFGGGDGGLERLQRGLVESVALQRALLTFTIGFASFAVCFAAVTVLRRRARATRDALRRVAAIFTGTPARGDM